ncbi:hypothetical protein Tco_0633592 [Tanacetum coccineum]
MKMASAQIKLEDLQKLSVSNTTCFKDLDLPKDYPVIIVDESDEDEPNAKTKDTSLELEKNKAEAEAALLKAQPSFLNVEQLNELLVKSLQTGFSKILSSHDFSSSLPTELKDLPSKIKELTEKRKGLKTQVRELEIELPKELKEIPTKLEDFTKTVTSLKSQVAELKTLQWELPKEFISLLEKVESAQGDQSVPLAGQADIMHVEGEKDTNQATISQLFQRRVEKIAEKDKGRKVISSEKAEKESIESDSDNEAHVIGSMVKSSKEGSQAEASQKEGVSVGTDKTKITRNHQRANRISVSEECARRTEAKVRKVNS